jgi:hypothetical protein
MAYMNQERKSLLAAELKKVVPHGWKYSLAVRHHSTVVMTITEAPFDLLASLNLREGQARPTSVSVNTHHVRHHFEDECVADVFEAIASALNTGNHDRSDSQSDYFDVGWYVDVRVGRWDKPFTVSQGARVAA